VECGELGLRRAALREGHCLTSIKRPGFASSSITFGSKQSIEEKNKTLVLDAFETLFNKRDRVLAERYRSQKYIQHSAHIPPGREALFYLVKIIPARPKYEKSVNRHGLES
jgi:hypothetical protein